MRRPLALLVILLALGVSLILERDGADPPAPGGDAFGATVERVVDGDSVVVRRRGGELRVRLVQIDAPESSASRFGAPDECGPAATRFAERLVAPGDRVTIEPAGRDATDRYGRVLAYVRLGGPDAETWQEAVVRAGWAQPYVFDGNETPLLPRLRELADEAEADCRGVWDRCGGRFRTAG